MAVTSLTANALVKDTVSADLVISGGTAIDATKTMQVLYPIEGKLLLVINNTFAGSKNFTLKAGSFLSAGQGDYTFAVGQNDVVYLVVSSTRFKDSDGYLNITFEDSTTGFVRAIALPY